MVSAGSAAAPVVPAWLKSSIKASQLPSTFAYFFFFPQKQGELLIFSERQIDSGKSGRSELVLLAGCVPFGAAGATKMLAAAALQEIHGQGEEIQAGSRQAAPGAAQLRAESPRRGSVGLRGGENWMLTSWGA